MKRIPREKEEKKLMEPLKIMIFPPKEKALRNYT